MHNLHVSSTKVFAIILYMHSTKVYTTGKTDQPLYSKGTVLCWLCVRVCVSLSVCYHSSEGIARFYAKTYTIGIGYNFHVFDIP